MILAGRDATRDPRFVGDVNYLRAGLESDPPRIALFDKLITFLLQELPYRAVVKQAHNRFREASGIISN